MTWLLWRAWGLVRWVLRLHTEQDRYQCPWCNGLVHWGKSPHYRHLRGGSYASPGEPTVHWGEGVTTCPRCRYSWEWGDSN